MFWVAVLILGGCAWALHTPSPSREGSLGWCFFVENKDFECCISPLERGLKGCVMVRGAG